MSDVAGCPECGSLRFDPVKIHDNGDMLAKCRGCGETLLLGRALEFDVPDRNGNVFSKECLKNGQSK